MPAFNLPANWSIHQYWPSLVILDWMVQFVSPHEYPIFLDINKLSICSLSKSSVSEESSRSNRIIFYWVMQYAMPLPDEEHGMDNCQYYDSRFREQFWLLAFTSLITQNTNFHRILQIRCHWKGTKVHNNYLSLCVLIFCQYLSKHYIGLASPLAAVWNCVLLMCILIPIDLPI